MNMEHTKRNNNIIERTTPATLKNYSQVRDKCHSKTISRN